MINVTDFGVFGAILLVCALGVGCSGGSDASGSADIVGEGEGTETSHAESETEDVTRREEDRVEGMAVDSILDKAYEKFNQQHQEGKSRLDDLMAKRREKGATPGGIPIRKVPPPPSRKDPDQSYNRRAEPLAFGLADLLNYDPIKLAKMSGLAQNTLFEVVLKLPENASGVKEAKRAVELYAMLGRPLANAGREAIVEILEVPGFEALIPSEKRSQVVMELSPDEVRRRERFTLKWIDSCVVKYAPEGLQGKEQGEAILDLFLEAALFGFDEDAPANKAFHEGHQRVYPQAFQVASATGLPGEKVWRLQNVLGRVAMVHSFVMALPEDYPGRDEALKATQNDSWTYPPQSRKDL